MRKLVLFDLDGTLAESKLALDGEMVSLLNTLLGLTKVAIISGGDWPQFEKQVLSLALDEEVLPNLTLLPTCGTKLYIFKGSWKRLYSEELDANEKEKITTALRLVANLLGYVPEETWGETIEDRGSQITFSALGQSAPLAAKILWDPDFKKRLQMQELLTDLIPEFSIRSGGSTSIDVTKSGIDKAYGVRKLARVTEVATSEMIFVGDALFPGGNDYPIAQMDVHTISVVGPYETKRVVEGIIACF